MRYKRHNLNLTTRKYQIIQTEPFYTETCVLFKHVNTLKTKINELKQIKGASIENTAMNNM